MRTIPPGLVRTYADIDPAAPRAVGRILARIHDVPWHRVIRADGSAPLGAPQLERSAAKESRCAATASISSERG